MELRERGAQGVCRGVGVEGMPVQGGGYPREGKSFALALRRIGALRFGVFALSSGKISSYYLDLRLIPSFPKLFKRSVEILASLAERSAGVGGFKAVAGVPTAGLVYASALAYELHKPLVYVRKDAKGWGTDRLVEGALKPRASVLLVDDVVTSGKSILAAARAIRREGGVVRDAIVLVDREEGGAKSLASEGIRLNAFLKISELSEILYSSGKISKREFEAITGQGDVE